ncbi:MAG: hypothetical protein PVH64_13540 [Bacillota bacterium]|jgi:hypothetical protein
MEKISKLYYVILALAALFALWGFTRWLQAQVFTPPAPVTMALNHYSFQKAVAVFPLSRYARLQTGELFFGPVPETPQISVPEPVKPVFSSKLLLYGVSKAAQARIDRAVVGLSGDPAKQTWLVQVGSVVAGETVVKIEEKGIWVKNATGRERIALRK